MKRNDMQEENKTTTKTTTGLDKKYVFSLFLAIMIPLSIGGIILYQFETSSQIQKRGVKDSFFLNTETLSASISKLFFSYYHSVQALAKNPDLRTGDREKIAFALNEFKSMMPNVDYAIMLNADGGVLAHSNINNKFKKLAAPKAATLEKAKDLTWYQKLKNGEFSDNVEKGIFYSYAGKIGYDAIAQDLYGEKRLGHFFATVIEDEFGDTAGYVALFYNQRWLKTELEELGSGLLTAGHKKVAISLYNGENKLIARFPEFNEDRVLEESDASGNKALLNLRNNQKGVSLAPLEDSSPGMHAYQTISNKMFLSKIMGWKTMLSSDATHAMKEIEASRLTIFAVISSAVLICIVLIARNIQIMHRLKIFNTKLEAMVAERTRELQIKTNDIRTMLSNIKLGIFTVMENRHVHHEYSDHLADVLEAKGDSIGGRSISELLLSKANLSHEDAQKVDSALEIILGEEELSYDLNESNLIRECTYQKEEGSKEKQLEIEWNPIVDSDDIVTKLLVSIRDVTEIRALQAETAKQQRKMDMIAQILEFKGQKFASTMTNLEGLYKGAVKFLKNDPDCAMPTIESIFVNLHTLKGNARINGLSHISSVTHTIESRFMALRDDPDNIKDYDLLLSGLNAIGTSIEEYKDINENTLGRGGGGSEKGLMVPVKELDRILELISKEQITESIDLLESLKIDISGGSLQSIITEMKKNLDEVAKKLDKQSPVINLFGDDKLTIEDESVLGILDNILPHLLINALDHGIEAPKVREQKGKKKAGTIKVDSKLSEDGLSIELSDDGAGLNLKKLREKGGADKSDTETAMMIFESGLSSKEDVTELSGRGVGLDAVKTLVENAGGKITIGFLGDMDQDGYRPFQINIFLPLSASEMSPHRAAS